MSMSSNSLQRVSCSSGRTNIFGECSKEAFGNIRVVSCLLFQEENKITHAVEDFLESILKVSHIIRSVLLFKLLIMPVEQEQHSADLVHTFSHILEVVFTQL